MRVNQSIRILCVLLVILIAVPVLAPAEDGGQAVRSYLQGKMDDVFNVLKNPALNQAQKNGQIVDIVSPMFDFPLMTGLAFGKKHWAGMTSDQKVQFNDLFVKLLKKSFIEKLVLYTDEKVTIKDVIQKKNKVSVSTVLISQGKEFDMGYKFYHSDKGWKIYDLEIQNISVISTYRSQIDDVLKTGTYEELMIKLEKPDENKKTK